jgi:hypothetical protein
MKHTVKNDDGSFTTVDSEDDGMGLYLFSSIMSKIIHKKKLKEQAELEQKEEEKMFPYFCKGCHKRFKTEKQCMAHIYKVHPKGVILET